MIEQTIPLAELTGGMARCVREWILPHLTDPMARIQAEQLATLLEALPRALSPAAAQVIRADADEARLVLENLGASAPATTGDGSIDDLMKENAVLKVELERMADELRRGGAEARERLTELQRFFVRSLTREVGGAVAEGTDFVSLTSKDSAARKK